MLLSKFSFKSYEEKHYKELKIILYCFSLISIHEMYMTLFTLKAH